MRLRATSFHLVNVASIGKFVNGLLLFSALFCRFVRYCQLEKSYLRFFCRIRKSMKTIIDAMSTLSGTATPAAIAVVWLLERDKEGLEDELLVSITAREALGRAGLENSPAAH